MTLDDIKLNLRGIEKAIDTLQEEAKKLDNESIAEFLDCELGYISYRISELAELEVDSEGNADTDGLEDGLQEWWDDLLDSEKSQIVGIPTPRLDDRGDDQYEFDQFCDKWWKAKTIQQKQETYKEWSDELPWWEKE